MKKRPVHVAMLEARGAISELGSGCARNRLSLDLRASLMNLDASLERALAGCSDDLGAGPDQLEVYSRLRMVQEAAAADGPGASAAVHGIIAMLDRRGQDRK